MGRAGEPDIPTGLDLVLLAADRRGQLVCDLVYRKNRIDRQIAADFATRFVALLEAMIEHLGETVGALLRRAVAGPWPPTREPNHKTWRRPGPWHLPLDLRRSST